MSRLIVFSLVLCSLLSLSGMAYAQEGLPSSTTDALASSQDISRFEECQDLTLEDLRDNLNDISQEMLETELQSMGLQRMVAEQWLSQDVESVISREVALGVEQVRENTNYLDRLWSGWNPNKAQELAEEVALYAYGGEGFNQAVEGLASSIAAEVSSAFETTVERSANSAVLCVQNFVAGNYGVAVLNAFEGELIAQVDDIDGIGIAAEQNPSDLPLGTLLGVSVIIGGLIARRLINRLSRKITERIAGKITARVAGRAASAVVPVIGWIVGLGLIAFDLIEGNDGALPAIQEALTSQEIVQEIQSEIVLSIDEELADISVEAARDIADSIYAQWRDFQFKFQRVLDFADSDDRVQNFLASLNASQFHMLAESLNVLGEDGVLDALGSGQLRKLMLLPESALRILQDQGSLDEVFAWAEIAGSRLDEVVSYGIYRHKQAGDFSVSSLERLLQTDNDHTISTLILMPNEAIGQFLSISLTSLNNLSANLDFYDLEDLAWYLEHLDQDGKNSLLTTLQTQPEIAGRYSSNGVKTSIQRSRSQRDAVIFLAGEPSLWKLSNDIPRLLQGDVSRQLFFAKYSLTQFLALGLLVLAALLLMIGLIGRRLRPRRRR